ncbi:hypothetical protein [Deinococcus sp. 6GRE01]|uniref:hypothetical protein n=1 Tax=Deinococcus sp. 6GRE01 TaxID=2745873 RepID=UPI001E58CC24|nr:hypothetical protein [Deinococcus sp. 6GRE01]MCD0156334.1 hypothetical protein [Deinococcus sp. 6GRE01]
MWPKDTVCESPVLEYPIIVTSGITEKRNMESAWILDTKAEDEWMDASMDAYLKELGLHL